MNFAPIDTVIRTLDEPSTLSQSQHPRQLAVFGGRPAFAEKLHVGRPNVGDRESFLARVGDMLDRVWLTNDGPFVQELERRIAAYLGVRHCVAMCNGTVALEIAIRALGLTGEVIVPSYTFIATAHALQWQQITPVFADIREDTHCLDPDAVERMITPRTTGIIGVHLWGQACDVDALTEVARRRNLRLMFDAAHAFGCTHKGRLIGNNGDAEVFSFHATKFFNTLEGGAVLTNDDELAKKMRLMRNFGFGGYDDVVYIGTNGKMNEVSAAMGLTNLDNIDAIVDANRRNWLAYRDGLTGLPGVKLFHYSDCERSNYQYVMIEVDDEAARLNRDELVSVFWAENVIARRYFWPGCHRMEPYRSLYPHAGLLLPVTERAAARVLLLPTGTAIGPDAVSAICNILRTALAHAGDVRARLAR
jgi:dTDP-4-amino-4,6-dideoxygalactose transaminase